ncbi:MAG TPA: methionyl-tRNA formyltransferase [Casimicrobiaceae bacterium]|nr:methionyl-tRNA formyltransferase [Casimicrobiaceae bacterium]
MRVGFAGTPEFAVRALAAIHAAGHTIPVVLTQPDRPSGRGLAVTASPVRRYAEAQRLHVLQPRTLRDAAAQTLLAETAVDVLVVAAYGLILPRPVLDWPTHGCLNIHASLLPRWRGAAPIARAIEAGDATTGITIMQMDEGLDTGAMIETRAFAIGARETAGTLHDRLADLGAAAIVDVLAILARDGRLPSRPQPGAGVTYAAKLGRADAAIDWNASPIAIDRRIRAMSPAPGAGAAWQGAGVKLWAAEPLEAPAVSVLRTPAAGTADLGDLSPGTVAAVGAAGIDVVCGPAGSRGLLRVVEVQPAGGRRMAAAAFAAGRRIVAGSRFGSPPHDG